MSAQWRQRAVRRAWWAATVVAVVCGIGAAARPAGAIYNGVDAQFSQFPWMVSVQSFDAASNSWRHICGGTLVAPTWILTAAHCVFDVTSVTPANEIRVVVGKDKPWSQS